MGNLLNMRDYANGNQVQAFGYDPLDRLTSAAMATAAPTAYGHTYRYDRLGNITGRTEKVLICNPTCSWGPFSSSYDYTYGDAAHKQAVTAVGFGYSFSYDANGNMISRTEGCVIYTQNFNVENELTSVVTGSNTTTFTWGLFNKRVIRGNGCQPN